MRLASIMRHSVPALAAAMALSLAACETPHEKLAAAVAAPERSAAFRARDASRNPEQALAFLGVRDTMTVVEIYPGAGYWSEILAPYLRANGSYIAAAFVPTTEEGRAFRRSYEATLAADPIRYGRARVVDFAADGTDVVPPGTADMVLTFRNLHNWMARGTEDAVLTSFFRALKPGGILGISDHRASGLLPVDPKAKNGYVREDHAIMLAERAGFRLVARSEAKSNPKDTKDHPQGVWTLPPTLRLKDQDRAKYEAIGESDRFLLKFVKPAD
jgi:predicted methyltransferase